MRHPPHTRAAIQVLFGGGLALLVLLDVLDVAPVRRAVVVGLASIGCHLVAAWTALSRARQAQLDALGWRLVAVGCAVPACRDVLSLGAYGPPVGRGIGPVVFSGVALLSHLLLVAALAAWLWRPWNAQRRRLHALGAVVFAGSLLHFVSTARRLTTHAGAHDRWLTGASIVWAGVILVGGVALYLIVEDPRRMRSAVGWVFASLLLMAMHTVHPPVFAGARGGGLLAILGAVSPLAIVISAASGAPFEEALAHLATRPRLIELLLYVPFALAGLALLTTALSLGHVTAFPVVAFLALVMLVAARELVLRRDLRSATLELERRLGEQSRDLETLQAMLARAQRLTTVAAIGAGLTHDINNLLTAIQGGVALLRTEVARGIWPRERTVAAIVETSERAGTLVRKAMALSAGALTVRRPAGELLASMENTLRLLVRQEIDLRFDVDDGVASATVDAPSFEQVVLNLVSNARDAIESQGIVTVALRPSRTPEGRAAVLVEVQDTGTGISDDVRARLFEPFFTTKQAGRGTGLGLASVKAIADELGGGVEVQSMPGEGTRFAVWFPQADAP